MLDTVYIALYFLVIQRIMIVRIEKIKNLVYKSIYNNGYLYEYSFVYYNIISIIQIEGCD